MKINRSLIPIKLHYFLRYAGSSFMTIVLPLVVRQKGISASGIGFLWTTMPVVGLITNSVSGALADYFKAHRAVFLFALTTLTTGLVMTYSLPCLPINKHSDTVIRDLVSLQGGINATFKNTSRFDVNVPKHVTDSNSSEQTVSSVMNDSFVEDMVNPEMVMEEGHILSQSSAVQTEVDTTSLSYQMQFPEFWFIFLAILVEQLGLATLVMISDAVCFLILGTEKQKYGEQRLWGTIGMGAFSILTGFLVDLYSKGLPQTDYFPAVIICVVFMSVDWILVATMKIPVSKETKLKMGDVGSVLVSPHTVQFMIYVFVTGMSLGLLWVFKFMYIEDVANEWDPNFAHLKLLQGLDLGIETFGGELPFFFLSGMIINRLGHSVVFAVCLGTLSLRCIFYFAISNPWWFLPVEFLNGISFALFYACMASYASVLAPPGAQATLQALVRACFSIGTSSAGFIGGVLYQSIGGANMFLSAGLFSAVCCVLYVLSQILINKFCSQLESIDDRPCSSATHSNKDSSSANSCGRQGENVDNGQDKKENVDIKDSLMKNV